MTTKGVWYPDKSMADKDPPLYLHVTAVRSLSSRRRFESRADVGICIQQTQEILDAGIKAVQELIDQELGPLIDQSRFRDRDAPRERVRRVLLTILDDCADFVSLCSENGRRRKSSSTLSRCETSMFEQKLWDLE